MKNTYTIFGKGFVGTNISNFLLKKKYKVFLAPKNKYKFNTNLYNIIYCIGNDNWIKDPKGSYEANLGIIPEIIFNNKFHSFTLISSTRVYAQNVKRDTKEKSSILVNPNDINFFYNSLKLSAESLCLALPNKKNRFIRMSNLFGNYFTSQIYLLPTLIRDSLYKKKISIFINKNSSKDFLFVDEAINVLIKIIKKGKYRLYNVASGENIKLFKVSEKIKKITDCKIIYKNQKRILKDPIINIKRIKKEFNFKPKKKLIPSLRELIVNYKKNA